MAVGVHARHPKTARRERRVLGAQARRRVVCERRVRELTRQAATAEQVEVQTDIGASRQLGKRGVEGRSVRERGHAIEAPRGHAAREPRIDRRAEAQVVATHERLRGARPRTRAPRAVRREPDIARPDAERVDAGVERTVEPHPGCARTRRHGHGPRHEPQALTVREQDQLQVPREALRAQARDEILRDVPAHGLQAGLRVAERQSEQHGGGEVVDARERAARKRPVEVGVRVVLAADGEVGAGGLEACHQRFDVARRDLEVGVVEHDDRLRGGRTPGRQRAPLAAIALVGEHADARVLRCHGPRGISGAVAAPVVDHEDLERTLPLVQAPREATQVGIDVGRLVEGRQEDREARAHPRDPTRS